MEQLALIRDPAASIFDPPSSILILHLRSSILHLRSSIPTLLPIDFICPSTYYLTD